MKYTPIILLLFACAAEPAVKYKVTKAEVLAGIDSIKSELVFNTSDSTIQGESDATIAYINLLQTKVISLQLSEVELIGVKKQLKAIRSDKKELFSKIEKLKKDKAELEADKAVIITELKAAVNKAKSEKESTTKALIERNKLQEKINRAGKFSIDSSNVNVEAYYLGHKIIHTKKWPYVKDTLVYIKTDRANKVQQVRISFRILPNKFANKDSIKIRAIIHGTAGIPENKGIQEKIKITNNGKGGDHTIAFNQAIDWRASEHIVELFNEKELLYTGKLTLK